jgi:hypothetical protein
LLNSLLMAVEKSPQFWKQMSCSKAASGKLGVGDGSSAIDWQLRIETTGLGEKWTIRTDGRTLPNDLLKVDRLELVNDSSRVIWTLFEASNPRMTGAVFFSQRQSCSTPPSGESRRTSAPVRPSVWKTGS